MKKISLFYTLIFTFSFIVGVQTISASTVKTQKKSRVAPQEKKSSSKLGAKLGTEFQFDELSVHGQYQSAYEGVATVENEKELEDLLDYRTHYKDRLLNSTAQK